MINDPPTHIKHNAPTVSTIPLRLVVEATYPKNALLTAATNDIQAVSKPTYVSLPNT